MRPQVSVVLPILFKKDWQIPMTECCIKTMAACTHIPYELIVVETESDFFSPCGHNGWAAIAVKKYHHEPRITNSTADVNKGLALASAPYVVYMTNDVMVRDNWLEHLLETFEKKPDCGIAMPAQYKHSNEDYIHEGFFGACMMFRRGDTFDESFPSAFGDADLVARLYRRGSRAYINRSARVVDLGMQTFSTIETPEETQAKFLKYRTQFQQKHADIIPQHELLKILAGY